MILTFYSCSVKLKERNKPMNLRAVLIFIILATSLGYSRNAFASLWYSPFQKLVIACQDGRGDHFAAFYHKNEPYGLMYLPGHKTRRYKWPVLDRSYAWTLLPNNMGLPNGVSGGDLAIFMLAKGNNCSIRRLSDSSTKSFLDSYAKYCIIEKRGYCDDLSR